MNLTIEGTAPICSTLFNRHSGKLQMSCQWLQVNEGDRAQLVAGNQVLYEYETLRINYNGDLHLSNKLIAYVALEKIFNEEIMPSRCDILNDKGITNGSCTFPTVQSLSIRKDQNQSDVLDCYKFKDSKAASCWYGTGGNLLPINYSDDISLVNIKQIVLICGEYHGHVKVQDIINVRIQIDVKCNLSVLPKSEGENSSNILMNCENISGNASPIEEDNVTSWNGSPSNDALTPIQLTTIYSVVGLSALALIFSICGCCARCYQTFLIKKAGTV